MKKYFLDTNIILDFLANREPFGRFALSIFGKALTKEWELWTSDNSITTVYYFLEKSFGREVAKKKIGQLLNHIEIQPIRKSDLQLALVSRFNDFEDGVQHVSAVSIEGIEGIITRNRKDFKYSQVPVWGPEEVLLEN